MTTAVSVRVAPQGVLVSHPLLEAWGDVEEVEIEQYPDAIVGKPRTNQASQTCAEIVAEMKAAGLIKDLSWIQSPVISPDERARLAKKPSRGKPLSEIIIEEREDRA